MATKSRKESLLDLFHLGVEVYLSHVIKPFLNLHEKFYMALNVSIRSYLDEYTDRVPHWFTANFITYLRTAMVVPTIMWLVHGHRCLPAVLVLAVDFGDFLDGVVARYWVDRRAIDAVSIPEESKEKPKLLASWIVDHREKSYGGFIDAVCDKAYLVPIWLLLLAYVPSSHHFWFWQYTTLWFLIWTEIASGCIRFKAYFTCNGVSAPTVPSMDFSTSAVKADHIGKAKQTFEMFGTAFFILPYTRYIGLILLSAAVPLAYESVRRKVKKRVIYVDGTTDKFDINTLKFWKQAKGLGSKLIVGFSERNQDMILLAKSCESVDFILQDAPSSKLTLNFLHDWGIDFVVCGVGHSSSVVSSELVAAKRCLIILDDKTAKPLEYKDVSKSY